MTPNKGLDVLLAALAPIADMSWRCALVGALDLDGGFVDHLRRLAS